MFGIFEDAGAPPEALPAPRTRDPEYPFFEARPGGFVIPHNLDNNKAIEFYQDTLTDLMEHYGLRHEGVLSITFGLAVLYDVKAGIEKDSSFYDNAIEVLNLAQGSLFEMMGAAAYTSPVNMEIERRKAKLIRKKHRRVAKGQ